MSLPYLNLSPLYQRIQADVEPKILEILSSGQYIMSPHVSSCEEALAKYTGADHAYAVSNGTIALQIALMAAGVGPGDEVIVPAFSFFATAEMVSVLGARPVFVDVDEETFNINLSEVEANITTKTKAIIPVSLYGQMPDLAGLMDMAISSGIYVIEDAAQSFGAAQNGKRSCSVAHMSCTSFFPAKPLGAAGDGGAIFTNDGELAKKIDAIRVHGQTGRYYHEYIGVNGRLDPIQCVVIEEKLKHYDKDIKARQAIGEFYSKELADLPSLRTPVISSENQSVYAQYTLTVDGRDEFVTQLKSLGVPTSIHYPKGMHQQPAYAHEEWSLPITERLAEQVVSLPLYPFMPEEDQKTVVSSIRDILLR